MLSHHNAFDLHGMHTIITISYTNSNLLLRRIWTSCMQFTGINMHIAQYAICIHSFRSYTNKQKHIHTHFSSINHFVECETEEFVADGQGIEPNTTNASV